MNMLEGGFKNDGKDSAKAFRKVLHAMSHPGQSIELETGFGPAPLSRAAATCLLTLCDNTTPLFIGASHKNEAVAAWISFNVGAPLTNKACEAQFALGDWLSMTPIRQFPVGTPLYPDQSATLIVDDPSEFYQYVRLVGPGIKAVANLRIPSFEELEVNQRAYPLGLDFMFCRDRHVVALPRSTRLELLDEIDVATAQSKVKVA